MPKRKESQIAKFRAAARDLDADDDEKGLNEKLGKIAKAKAAARPRKRNGPSEGISPSDPKLPGRLVCKIGPARPQ
jgi:hypothetical protein